MAKGNKGKGKAQKRDELERKRDERSRRKVLKKEREIKEYLQNDENFVSFKNQLEAIGMKIKDILGDGNCLFRALGDQLNGDHTAHAYHRRNTVHYIKNHREDFEPFLEDGTTFDKHLTELSKLGTYGGNDSIVAFARNNGVNIVIHQLDNPRWVIHGSEFSTTGEVIELHLAYHNGEHYSSVRRVTDPDNGPAWQYNQKEQQHVKSRENNIQKDNKAKKKNERKKKSNPALADEVKLYNDEFINEACQIVMANTGCQDLELIKQALQENNYNIDTSALEVLQVMCVFQDQDVDGAKGCLSYDITANKAISTEKSANLEQNLDNICVKIDDEMDHTFGECNPGVTCGTETNENTHEQRVCSEHFLKVDRTMLDYEVVGNLKESSSIQVIENNRQLPPGARPKENISKKSHIKTPRLTNRQRKEQARREKKKLREERRINEQQAESVTALKNTVHLLVADLGAVSI